MQGPSHEQRKLTNWPGNSKAFLLTDYNQIQFGFFFLRYNTCKHNEDPEKK